MDQKDIADKLRKRALVFHNILVEHKVYIKSIDEVAFLQLTNDRIEREAKSIYAGEGTPWLTLLTFPAHDLPPEIESKTNVRIGPIWRQTRWQKERYFQPNRSL